MVVLRNQELTPLCYEWVPNLYHTRAMLYHGHTGQTSID